MSGKELLPSPAGSRVGKEVAEIVAKKLQFPLTPDDSLRNSDSEDESVSKQGFSIDQKSTENAIEEVKKIRETPKKTRKLPLRYRPPNGTILEISSFTESQSLQEQDDQIDVQDLSFLHHALEYSQRMVVVSGAGISVGSGIPDFRSANGLFQGLSSQAGPGGSGKQLFDYNVFRSEESTQKFHKMIQRLFQMSREAEPSKFHRYIDKVSGSDRLVRLYTQNIDCLEIQLPNLATATPLIPRPPFPKTIQLHGNVQLMSCSKCKYTTNMDPSFFEHSKGGICPECEEWETINQIAGKRARGCGVMRPRIVLYNEFHPDGETIGKVSATDLRAKPDCLVVVGTTLKIPGVRRLVKELSRVVHSQKGCIIWINTEMPSMSIVDYVEHFDLIVVGDCQLIPTIMEKFNHEIASKKRKPRQIKERQGKVIKKSKKNLKQSQLVPIKAEDPN
ncbi:unnamed protein product [Kuraishia capsulata CBS 1993]|uniref:Deacetylase sirtuin-type domain-containing protein n=1 Tax=Kuraishia capsulata CBS 1993 TaxID=1382522 RepID=W6MR83_9ASCO|nr:uncharacterized protein KUCA_T00003741001 [Kuraishia capsulata CBS 1993]CDK27762.1 unnamed protein product [Kuraishia capsulata CBS 1993]